MRRGGVGGGVGSRRCLFLTSWAAAWPHAPHHNPLLLPPELHTSRMWGGKRQQGGRMLPTTPASYCFFKLSPPTLSIIVRLDDLLQNSPLPPSFAPSQGLLLPLPSKSSPFLKPTPSPLLPPQSTPTQVSSRRLHTQHMHSLLRSAAGN